MNVTGNGDAARLGVARQEPVGDRVIPARAQVVEAQVGVVALAAIEIDVRRCAGLGEQVAEGVVLVGIGDHACEVGQHAHRALAIVDVEARRPSIFQSLALADALVSVGVGTRDRAANQFLDHLRVAGRRKIVHQVLRGDAAGGLGGQFPKAVVAQRDLAAIHRDQLQPRVIGVGFAAGPDRIAVSVVGFGLRLVVRVEGVRPGAKRAQRRSLRRPVAHGIENIAD